MKEEEKEYLCTHTKDVKTNINVWDSCYRMHEYPYVDAKHIHILPK